MKRRSQTKEKTRTGKATASSYFERRHEKGYRSTSPFSMDYRPKLHCKLHAMMTGSGHRVRGLERWPEAQL